jgi:basic amino acid/polyamine antiporter, APA family
MNQPAIHTGSPKQQLSLLDAVSIIIGIVIGVGIYETSPVIAASVTTPVWLILIWLIGGVLSMVGALCYAELATAYPEEGGDYVYLTKAWGRRMGFLFAWAGFWMVRPANIGAIAFIFAHYAQQIMPLRFGHSDLTIYAASLVILLTLVNIIGVKSGKWLQNIMTAAKIFGLLMIITIGLLISSTGNTVVTDSISHSESNLYLAFILVLFTYGGWSNISYVAAEVVQPGKNILRSLVMGTLVITVIYVVINLAFLRTLGMEGMSNSQAIASDMMYITLGEGSALFISLLICITCLSAVNGMIFTEARIYYALGKEHRLYQLLGTWDRRLDAPVWSLTFQAIMTLALIILLGTDENAFERLVVFSAPLHWFFFLMVGLALFRFRSKDKNIRTGFRVPLYPWTPILFCLSTLFMLYASLAYAYEQRLPEAYWIIIIMIAGIVASFYDPVISDK